MRKVGLAGRDTHEAASLDGDEASTGPANAFCCGALGVVDP